MKRLRTVDARPIKVKKNTNNGKPAAYMIITDAHTNEQLHVGTPEHIKKVAKERYGKTIVV